ncbi:MAG TPA: DinB family protein [Pyrinomonadaceae bacterium]|nr:DinB family protein [Pyrinomonadaceae bacterium]
MNRTQWFERVFEFDQPLGLFPCTLERLRGTPARLEELVRGLGPEQLTARVSGGWSIQEQVGHLYDLDELHAGRLEDYRLGLGVLRPADLTNRRTHEADHNSADIGRLLALFREGRLEFVRQLEELDEGTLARTALHPRLQTPMRVADMALFTAEHDDHHLAAVTSLKRAVRPR